MCNNNAVSSGGAISCLQTSNPILNNNTISNNTAANGGAVYCENNSDPIFHNCILWGNLAGTAGNEIFLLDEACDPDFYYCDIQGGIGSFGLNGNFYTGVNSNNIDANPVFVSPSVGSGTGFNGVTADWSLQSTSPCINVGNNLTLTNYPTTDMAGNPRNICGTDIGAYEHQIGTCANITDVGIAKVSNSNTQLSIFPNPGNESINIKGNFVLLSTIVFNDVLGREVLTQTIKNKNETIDVSQLEKGIYFYNITNDKNEGVKGKWIKN